MDYLSTRSYVVGLKPFGGKITRFVGIGEEVGGGMVRESIQERKPMNYINRPNAEDQKNSSEFEIEEVGLVEMEEEELATVSGGISAFGTTISLTISAGDLYFSA